MDNFENTLEERLARLESGESLEACLADLPEDEARLLKKARALRTIASTASASSRLADQRRELLQLAREQNKLSSKPSSLTGKAWLRWAFPVALAGSAFVILTCFVIFSLLVGSSGLGRFNQRNLNQPIGIHSVVLEAYDPQSAVLKDLRGLVEIQDSDGTWKVAQAGQILKAGQLIRTGELSSVTLGFYDGSQTQVGPNSEMSIDQLDAQKSGPRVVVLTQHLGESNHDVAKSNDPASRYEVHTPSGVGTAKGTSFRVFVAIAQFVRFDVDEGAVSVSNLDTTVIVVAGQSTVIVFGQVPTPPVFRMRGEGIVEKTGAVWHIAGRTFRTDSNTVFVGDIKVGDLVAFQARIVADGSPILDSVVLVAETPDSRFSFTGTVDSIGSPEWTIAGRVVQVDEKTDVDNDIQVGHVVQVKGKIEDKKLLATDIRLIEENDEGQPFEFTGVIDQIGGTEWIISGVTLTVDDHTQIEAGLVVGDVVRVQGRILDDKWLAKSIERAEEDEREFSITGSVESIDPWAVDGIEFATDERTEIEDGIDVGDLVRVEGRILEDGSWVAEEIELIQETEPRRFSITGVVNSINPWRVGGIDFTTDGSTVIVGQILVGDLVHVNGVILPDGTLLAEKIERLENDLGCLSFSTAVRETGANQIVLLDWHVVQLNGEIEVEGELNVATVIIVSGCTEEDGGFSITHIIVIYQLDSLPVIIKHPSNNRDHEHEDDDHEHEEDE